MYRSLKPCIRCKGTGKVAIEILSPDRHEHTIAGMAKCHGCNGTGKVTAVHQGEPALTPEPEAVREGLQ